MVAAFNRAGQAASRAIIESAECLMKADADDHAHARLVVPAAIGDGSSAER